MDSHWATSLGLAANAAANAVSIVVDGIANAANDAATVAHAGGAIAC